GFCYFRNQLPPFASDHPFKERDAPDVPGPDACLPEGTRCWPTDRRAGTNVLRTQFPPSAHNQAGRERRISDRLLRTDRGWVACRNWNLQNPNLPSPSGYGDAAKQRRPWVSQQGTVVAAHAQR